MDKFTKFIGIDISKEYFDASILVENNQFSHNQFCNTKKGVKMFLKWIKDEHCPIETTLICMEHTGLYKNILVDVLTSNQCNVWVEMAYRIIRSSGIQRGKNDKVDSARIAQYAKKNQEEVKLFKCSKEVLGKIKGLLNLRELNVSYKTAVQVNIQELKGYNDPVYNLLSKSNKNATKAVKKTIEDIDKQLEELVKQDSDISQVYNCITSVKGVGSITALFLLCYTDSFTSFDSPRELASYCGVVPFEYTSGKSIRGKAKVHFMANKKLKKLLHLCALSSIRYDPEIKTYYEKKVEEGKHKILVLNNVKNKLIHRICSCVCNNKRYEVAA
ncbi:IS110 family transposase [Myroides marinus]|uniref:IS110 family transposase n=1 Tax=Myroides marinus TaxID=703342 RepID=UPI002575BC22|nr:IS110 family transposase [Myroides marinus]MDM1405480.1 IS110 family transposase [Myroides marinus]